jgi:long-chain acyl-CoA synthetase
MQTATSLNLASILDHQARMRPGIDAIVFDQVRIDYAALHGMVGHLANGLKALGYGPGDHIALCCPNLPFFPIAYYAILRIGATVVPLNVLMRPREIAYHLNDSDATGLLVFEGTPELPLAQLAVEAMPDAPGCRHLIVMTRNPQATEHEGQKTLASVMAGQSPVCPVHPTRPDDTAVMLYTSGTTGQPKGAELTHSNMVINASLSRDLQLPFIDVRPGARNTLLATLPLFHSYGQTVLMNAGLLGGSTIVLLPRFEPAAVIETMVREKVNLWAGVPTMFWALLDHVDRHHLSPHGVAEHLRSATSGGAPIPVEVLTRFEQVFGVAVLEGYGLSETSPVATFNQVGRPSKPGTVGLPMPYCEVAVVDDNDEPVPTGELGEVVIRGHNIMKGYYKRPEANAEVLRNGWFHSGDIGRLDHDGYLSIVDRKKDMIIRGGFNVYPRELEEVLMTHPAVSLVAVVGTPDERLGEEVKAVVVRKPGATVTDAELIEWSKGQFASFKYPRVIEFRDALPMGPTGKILKREMR